MSGVRRQSACWPFDRHARIAFIIVCVILAASSIGFRSAVGLLNVYLKKEPVELREHFVAIPSKLGSWEMVSQGERLSAEMVEELGTDLYLDRHYRYTDDGERWIAVHIAYYTGIIDAVPHVPDRCLVAGGFNTRAQAANLPLPISREGWQDDRSAELANDTPFPMITILDRVTRRPVTVRLPVGDFQLRTTEFSKDEMPDARIFAGYFFVANGRVAATPEAVKLLAFRRSEKYAYYCKVQLFAFGPPDFTVDDFVERAADFTTVLLPELMRCLPDWAEVQGMSTAAPGSDAESIEQRG